MSTYTFHLHLLAVDDAPEVYATFVGIDAHDEAQARAKLASLGYRLLDVHLYSIVTDDGVEVFRNERTLDALTYRVSAFDTFAALVNAKGGYRPTIHEDSYFNYALADAYDRVQGARGDERRAYRRPYSARF